MYIRFQKRAIKDFGKLSQSQQSAFKKRLHIFADEPFHPILHNHALHGVYETCRSINITGDIRAIYDTPETNTARFLRIGTHTQLYS